MNPDLWLQLHAHLHYILCGSHVFYKYPPQTERLRRSTFLDRFFPKIQVPCTFAQQYLDNKLDLAKKLVQEIEKQKRIDGLRAFFNFLGLKSICSMFATDFKDGYSYGEILERMSTFLLMEIRNEYSGWIFDIDRAVVLYSQAYAAVADN